MKTKPSNSTPRSSAFPPIPYKDEANDEYHVVDIDNGTFEGTGSGQDSVEEEDKFARAICLFRDILGEFSYKCEGPTSQLLVCSENGCPIAIHEVCMITEPAFDDTGKFYCPYCWYKRELERTEELRREALLAERDLLYYKYNLLKLDGGNGKKHEDGADNMKAANPSTMEGKNDSGDSENGLDHDQTICVESVCEEKYDYGSISKAHGPDNVAGGQLMQEDDIEDTSGSENDGNDDDGPRCMKPCNPNHFEIVNDTFCLSTKGTSNIAVVLNDNREKWVKEEPVMPNENGLNHDQTICVESVCEEKYDYGSISTAHGPNNVSGGQLMQEEDIENTSGSENDGNSDDGPRCMKPCNPNHFEIVNDTLCLSTKGTSNIAVVLDFNQEKWVKEEPVMPNALGTSMAPITKDAKSNVPAIESFQFVSPDLDTMTLIKRKKCIKHTAQRAWPRRVVSPKNHSFQPSTSPKERKIYQQGEATTATNSVQCQELTKRICSMNPTLGYGKRRRLNWTTEEEDMLKEGVRRFSLTVNKNIPWRKILEFGHNVFENRLSADLKDKWKKIMAKEDPKCDKGTLVRFEE